MKEIEELVALSQKYGSDSRFVIAGGGNTSYKNDNMMWVKASGHALATIDEEGFAIMDRKALDKMAHKHYSSVPAEREEQVKNDLANANFTKDRRPSVETSLHNCMDFPYVVHLHPTLVGGLMCSKNAKEECAAMFPDALYIEYTDPGYTLFKKVYNRSKAYAAEKGKAPQVIFLQNHGIFVGGNSAEEIDGIYTSIMAALEKRVSALPEGEAAICDDAVQFIPAVRSILSRSSRGLKTIKTTNNALVEYFIDNFDKIKYPFTPDGIVYCKSEFICLENCDAAKAEQKIEAYIRRRGHSPKVLLVKGVGLLAVGTSAADSETVTDVYLDSMKIAWYAASFGGEHPMTRRQISFIDNWEVENYRRKVGASGSAGRMEGKTIIVTGAAQGYGEGIARELVLQGANIVIADLNDVVAEKTARSFDSITKKNRVSSVKTDVSDYESLLSMVKKVVLDYGAIDVFVSNAGVVRAGGIEAMTPENFDFVTKINYKGYFLCVKAVTPIMKIQTSYDEEYFADIVQINSKSGLRGSKANFAYAGGKFGGIGLTQSFALELAPFRIKVNSICPGNYYDGPLWSDPERGLFVQYLKAGKAPGAKTVADVKEFYLSQVPMRKGCNPADVTKAIMYVIEQTGETGQAVPITGGQVMMA